MSELDKCPVCGETKIATENQFSIWFECGACYSRVEPEAKIRHHCSNDVEVTSKLRATIATLTTQRDALLAAAKEGKCDIC